MGKALLRISHFKKIMRGWGKDCSQPGQTENQPMRLVLFWGAKTFKTKPLIGNTCSKAPVSIVIYINT
ncbi:hypothetical protein G3A_12625 [Bacillus sp. 17376]|nr:hypothetical protein G3A_12625 [Bacillus sp. 17376]